MKYFSALYNSFLLSLLIALLSFKSEWLEMRINIGLILFAVWIVLFIVLALITKVKKFPMSFNFTLANICFCLILSFILYGGKRLSIIPASIIREGLHITSVSFSIINTIITVFLALGLITIFIKRNNLNQA